MSDEGITADEVQQIISMTTPHPDDKAASELAAPNGSAKPCELPCPKCGSSDIHRDHRDKGEEVDKRNLNDTCPTRPPFLASNWPYGYKAAKEHIGHHCRDCGYDWQSNILPNDPGERIAAENRKL